MTRDPLPDGQYVLRLPDTSAQDAEAPAPIEPGAAVDQPRSWWQDVFDFLYQTIRALVILGVLLLTAFFTPIGLVIVLIIIALVRRSRRSTTAAVQRAVREEFARHEAPKVTNEESNENRVYRGLFPSFLIQFSLPKLYQHPKKRNVFNDTEWIGILS
ncbi:hypothetical protein AruPA_00965 [Acidiphilium sp. PA]|uniref:hypothetical protein n=1 Tax=Acidiphilium sp. PA TaxID=2871705 RepID=UPI002244908A|nr:hypothetical protein [Acidiphilium sp. PA]MCW8305593.1 hypothetical protein [Acidiphilium sp. PA]